ncbi:Inorganic phosphate transporter pho84, partial [Aspergillus nanangensis]
MSLETHATTSRADLTAALHLISDSIAQQRQTTARHILTHPLLLLLLSALFLTLYLYITDLALLTTTTGCIMTTLVSVKYYTAKYLAAAEKTGTWTWLFQPDEPVVVVSVEVDLPAALVVLVARLDGQIIGTLVLRETVIITTTRTRHGRGSVVVGMVRAWTVTRKYRGCGVGKALWDEAER